MSIRLRNQNDAGLTLTLNSNAWCGLLDLAEDHGWNPMGAVDPDGWLEHIAGMGVFEPDSDGELNRGYSSDNNHLVLLEDALNLADSLERVFLAYEPPKEFRRYIYFYSELEKAEFTLTPGIGALLILESFCRQGAFTIERL